MDLRNPWIAGIMALTDNWLQWGLTEYYYNYNNLYYTLFGVMVISYMHTNVLSLLLFGMTKTRFSPSPGISMSWHFLVLIQLVSQVGVNLLDGMLQMVANCIELSFTKYMTCGSCLSVNDTLHNVSVRFRLRGCHC